jgi:hypothetical protein
MGQAFQKWLKNRPKARYIKRNRRRRSSSSYASVRCVTTNVSMVLCCEVIGVIAVGLARLGRVFRCTLAHVNHGSAGRQRSRRASYQWTNVRVFAVVRNQPGIALVLQSRVIGNRARPPAIWGERSCPEKRSSDSRRRSSPSVGLPVRSSTAQGARWESHLPTSAMDCRMRRWYVGPYTRTILVVVVATGQLGQAM